MSGLSSFELQRISTGSTSQGDEVEVHCHVDGKGPGLLLLHGHPQTSHIWRHLAPALTDRFTVVATDLRGYGRSSKPKGSDSHVEYSKREMAKDMVKVMSTLGFAKFDVIAHDRGARVAHRLALDHPGTVGKMMLLDIAPTLFMYENTNMHFANGYWHWFFLIQPHPGPENVMKADPIKFWDMLSQRLSHKNVGWKEEDVKEYQQYFCQPETIHGICEDYRASATIDLENDREDRKAGKKLGVEKLCIIWGGKGMIEAYGDVVGVWKGYADTSKTEVTGKSLDCGHYIPEEKPDELLREVKAFLA